MAMLKIKSGSPVDPMPPRFLSTIAPLILDNLTDLFNRSLLQSKVPVIWKAARVRPILKETSADPKILTIARSRHSPILGKCLSL